MHIIFGKFVGGRGAVGLLVLRMVVGAAFILHGWPKFQHAFNWMGPGAPRPCPLPGTGGAVRVWWRLCLDFGSADADCGVRHRLHDDGGFSDGASATW